jgi:hypothetical protein
LLIFFDDSEEVHYKTIVLAFISGVYRQWAKLHLC